MVLFCIMPGESFEDITKNVYSDDEAERQDATARWFDEDLHRRFSMLEAGSGVAERGLILFEERKQNQEDYRAMERRYRENPFDDDPHWLLMETTRLQFENQQSASRWGVFSALYTTIQEEIIGVPARETVDYDTVILAACARRIAEIERDPCKLPGMKEDLSLLVNDLGIAYRLEVGQHFTKLLHDRSNF